MRRVISATRSLWSGFFGGVLEVGIWIGVDFAPVAGGFSGVNFGGIVGEFGDWLGWCVLGRCKVLC